MKKAIIVIVIIGAAVLIYTWYKKNLLATQTLAAAAPLAPGTQVLFQQPAESTGPFWKQHVY